MGLQMAEWLGCSPVDRMNIGSNPARPKIIFTFPHHLILIITVSNNMNMFTGRKTQKPPQPPEQKFELTDRDYSGSSTG